MRLEDVRVGQKVVIKSKSVWHIQPFEKYLDNDYGTGKFFRDNGFAYVVFIEDTYGDDMIVVGDESGLSDGDGDFFLASDLELYDKPQIHVDMARQVFNQFKVLTQALESEQISEMFDHLVDATSNYIIEKLGLERDDFITSTVDNSLREDCTFDELLEELGVEVE